MSVVQEGPTHKKVAGQKRTTHKKVVGREGLDERGIQCRTASPTRRSLARARLNVGPTLFSGKPIAALI